MKFLQRLIDWILPEWYEPHGERMSYLLTLAWGLLITVGLQIIYFVLFSLTNFTLGMTINVLTILFAIISALFLKYTRYSDVAANILAGIIFFNTTINSYFTGGLHSSILLWILILPIISIFILRRWHGVIWLIAAILVLIIFFGFFPNGSPQSVTLIENHRFDVWVNLTVLLAVVWYSAVVIDDSKNKAIREEISAREEAHQFADELELELEHRKLIELALRESEERLDLAIRGAEMGLWDWNVSTGKMTRSEKWADILGMEPKELDITFDEWMELIHPEDRGQVETLIKEHLDGHSSIYRYEHRIRKKNGDWIWVLVSGAVTARDEESKPLRMVGVTLDITDKKMYEVHLQHLANTDALTGLINRRHFFELAHTEFKRAERYGLTFSVAMIDLDHFKKVNDQHGHMMGDHILFQFSRLFMDQIRDMDILARYGGEEFVILFPHVNSQEAFDSTERIRKMIEETTFHLNGEDIHLTVSMGIVSNIDHPTDDIESLIELADKGLYRAKNQGRNRVTIWDPVEDN